MNAAQIAEQAINKMDAEDAGLLPDAKDDANKGDDPKGSDDSKKDDKKQDDAKDDSTGKSPAGKDDKPAADKDAAKDDDKEGEFTADDALEVDEAPKTDTRGPQDNAGIRLSPDESKFVADNIGEPLLLRGMQGDKEVEIKAYSPGDIPADFKFSSDQQLVAAQTGFMRLEGKANELLGSFRQTQNQTAATDFEKRENEGIRGDVADLQKEGRFAKFKIQPGQPGFNDDPAAKQMTEILGVMQERNEMYMSQYNQGRPYKHIGFAEAFDIWEAKNPERQANRKRDNDQRKEDDERGKVADKVGTNSGMTGAKVQKSTIAPGTTISDILNRYDNEEW